jgi:hypothetical protein
MERSRVRSHRNNVADLGWPGTKPGCGHHCAHYGHEYQHLPTSTNIYQHRKRLGGDEAESARPIPSAHVCSSSSRCCVPPGVSSRQPCRNVAAAEFPKHSEGGQRSAPQPEVGCVQSAEVGAKTTSGEEDWQEEDSHAEIFTPFLFFCRLRWALQHARDRRSR